MHTIVISTAVQPPEGEPFKRNLWRDMAEVHQCRSRVYSTYIDVPSEDKRFVLRTMSKDLHLKIGSFEWRCHYSLVKMLEHEFVTNRGCQFLLCFKDAEKNSEKAVLVTKTVEGGLIVFTLALH